MPKSVQSIAADLVGPGSVLGVKRHLYDHYGVLMADGRVIHYTSTGSDVSSSNKVSLTSMEMFLRGERLFWRMSFPTKAEVDALISSFFFKTASLLNLPSRRNTSDFNPGFIDRSRFLSEYNLFSPSEVQDRAYSRLGEQRYNLLTSNCEHFAFWCATGLSHSTQVEAFLNGGLSLVSFLVAESILPVAAASLLRGRSASPLFRKGSYFMFEHDTGRVSTASSGHARNSAVRSLGSELLNTLFGVYRINNGLIDVIR